MTPNVYYLPKYTFFSSAMTSATTALKGSEGGTKARYKHPPIYLETSQAPQKRQFGVRLVSITMLRFGPTS